MRNVVLAVVIGLVFAAGAANATIPDPDLCTVDPCDSFLGVVTYPDPLAGGSAEFTVNVRNGDNDPIPNAFVEVVFLVQANHVFCGDVVLDGNTDALGNVVFNISAGGCTDGVDAVQIIANGTPLRTYANAKSADWDSTTDGIVGLSDFIFFGGNYDPGIAGCTDLFNSGGTGLDDFIGFGEAWGRQCP
jgi:hypothetical protein